MGEVILGLLELDPGSYLNARPRWRPTLPTRGGSVTGDFPMTDFLTFRRRQPEHPGAVTTTGRAPQGPGSDYSGPKVRGRDSDRAVTG